MPATSSGGSTIYPIGFPVFNNRQTIVNYAGTAGGSGNMNVGTVPAGKTFYCMGLSGLPGTRLTNGVSNGVSGVLASAFPIQIILQNVGVELYFPGAGYSICWGMLIDN